MNINIVPSNDVNIIDEERQKVCYELFLQGKTVTEITDTILQDYPTYSLESCISDLKSISAGLDTRVAQSQDYYDRRLEHTFRRLDELDQITRKLWDVYGDLENAGDGVAIVTLANDKQRILGRIAEICKVKANLQQVLATRVDVVHKVDQSRKAQEDLILLLKEVTADCPTCRKKVETRLAGRIEIATDIDFEE